jgi:hypothetical protein
VDAVADGQTRRALEIAGAAFAEGLEGRPGERTEYQEDAIALRLLALVAGEIEKLDAARARMAEGLSPPEAARAVGVPPHRTDVFLGRLAAWSAAGGQRPRWALTRALSLVAAADLALKGGGGGSELPARLILEELVLRLGPPVGDF